MEIRIFAMFSFLLHCSILCFMSEFLKRNKECQLISVLMIWYQHGYGRRHFSRVIVFFVSRYVTPILPHSIMVDHEHLLTSYGHCKLLLFIVKNII